MANRELARGVTPMRRQALTPLMVGLVHNWGCQCAPDILAPVLGPGVGRGVDFEVGGSRVRGSLRGHHGDQQA
jgi:hypothetical protein